MQNGNFAAADCGLVVLAAAATRLYGDHIFSWRQIAVVHELNPAGIEMKNLGFHYRLIATLRAPLNPNALFRILWIHLYIAPGRGEVVPS